MDSWLNVRNQQALSHFSEEQKLDAVFRMIAESSRNPQPVCHASLEALIRGVRRLQPEDLRVSGGFDARVALQLIVGNGEDGDVLLSRLERHCSRLSMAIMSLEPFLPRLADGVLGVCELPKLCLACLEAQNIALVPLDWEDVKPASELRSLLENLGKALGVDMHQPFKDLRVASHVFMKMGIDISLRITMGCQRIPADLRRRRSFLGKRMSGGVALAQRGLQRAFILEPHIRSLDGPAARPSDSARAEPVPPRPAPTADEEANAAAATAAVALANEQAREARRQRRAGVVPLEGADAARQGGRPLGVGRQAPPQQQAEPSRAQRRALGRAQARLEASRLADARKKAEADAAFLRATEVASFSKISARPVEEGPSVEEVERRLGGFLERSHKAEKHRKKREAKKLGLVHSSVVHQLFVQRDDGRNGLL